MKLMTRLSPLGGEGGVLVAEGEARDEDGDGHERAECEQGVEAQGGGADGHMHLVQARKA
jgi:hypothetical protein